jgi:4-amino-4-deoxy-L-arabinose transferase-like glycosyltransferase
LVAVLAFNVWLRGHTVGPDLRAKLGVNLYPVTGRHSEPLDCDEAVYAQIGKRLLGAEVLYRDLTDTKPPAYYWLYAAVIGVFGESELVVRLIPVPVVALNVLLVGWLAWRLSGPGAGVAAAFVFAVVSTDPFLFGNGANMEPLINLLATAALACAVAGWGREGRAWFVAAGAFVGAACLVKQVAITHAPVLAAALWLRRGVMKGDGPRPRTWRDRLGDLLALAAGFAAVCLAASAILVAQGAGREAFDDVFRYGRALATDTPPPPNAPPKLVRWFTGNADPEGRLPWPFGSTNYLVWWGAGSWPVWLAGVPALVWLAAGPGSDARRKLVAAWTLSAWVQVALPGLFWQHYYLLPVPGLAVAVGICLADQFAAGPVRRARRAFGAGLIVAVAATCVIQYREYLRVPPEELTVRDKGGRQWVALRDLGREIARRTEGWPEARIFLWGWQSPLYFYSGLDSASRQVFTDDLIRAHTDDNHPLIRPRVERIMTELREHPPALVFVAYPPFPALRAFLEKGYLPSRLVPSAPDGRGLWVVASRYATFEGAAR